MSCRRICRELLWLTRFGELGPDSQPHLEHLAACRGCRDEVGFDRAMVEQLRVALAERVANAAPSPRAWEGILARAQVPEPKPAVRLFSLVGRLRFASAMAGTGLALMLALNSQIVPMAVGPTTEVQPVEAANLLQVPRVLPERRASASDLGPTVAAFQPTDPEQALADAARAPTPRATDPAPGTTETNEPSLRTELRIVRPMQTPEPGSGGDGLAAAQTRVEAPASAPLPTEPGVPS